MHTMIFYITSSNRLGWLKWNKEKEKKKSLTQVLIKMWNSFYLHVLKYMLCLKYLIANHLRKEIEIGTFV